MPPEFDVTRLSWTRRQLAAVGWRRLPPGVIDRHVRDDVHFDRLDRLVVWWCLSGCQEDCRPLMPDGSRQPRQQTEWRYVETTAGRVYRFRIDARQEVGGVGVLDAAGSFLLTTIALDLRVDELVRLVRWHLVREFCRQQQYSLLIAGPQPGLSFSRARAVPDLPDRDCGRVRAARVVSDVPGLAVRAVVPPAPPVVRRVVLGGDVAGAASVEASGDDAAVDVPVHSSRVPVLRVEPRRPVERRAESASPSTGRNRSTREPSPELPTFHEMLATARAEAEASAEDAAAAGQFDDADEEADREVHQLMEQRFSPIRGSDSEAPRQNGRPVAVVRPRVRGVRHHVTHGRGRGIHWPPSRDSTPTSEAAGRNESRGARLAGIPVYYRGGTPPDDSQYDSDSDREMQWNLDDASPESTTEAVPADVNDVNVLPSPPGAGRGLGQYHLNQQH